MAPKNEPIFFIPIEFYMGNILLPNPIKNCIVILCQSGPKIYFKKIKNLLGAGFELGATVFKGNNPFSSANKK